MATILIFNILLFILPVVLWLYGIVKNRPVIVFLAGLSLIFLAITSGMTAWFILVMVILGFALMIGSIAVSRPTL